MFHGLHECFDERLQGYRTTLLFHFPHVLTSEWSQNNKLQLLCLQKVPVSRIRLGLITVSYIFQEETKRFMEKANVRCHFCHLSIYCSVDSIFINAHNIRDLPHNRWQWQHYDLCPKILHFGSAARSNAGLSARLLVSEELLVEGHRRYQMARARRRQAPRIPALFDPNSFTLGCSGGTFLYCILPPKENIPRICLLTLALSRCYCAVCKARCSVADDILVNRKGRCGRWGLAATWGWWKSWTGN